MKFTSFNLSSLVAAIAFAGSSVTNAQDERNDKDIPGTAIDAGSFTTLVAALGATDLVSAISSPNGPFTVFAPTDDAFDSLPNGLVECLLEEDNRSVLSDILLYHVASGEALSTDLIDGMEIATLLQGQDVVVDLSDGVKINDSTVIAADVLTSNGVIHIINQVLVPPSVDVAAFLETCALVDIPTTAVNAGIFNTLVAALGATDLVGAISSPNGPFTVFAPTDDAFAALPNGLVTCLLEEENKPVLSNILLYHVVSGEALSTDLTNGMKIPTLLQGKDVTVDLSDGVKINDSTVTTADVLAANGVIHIINQVLVPSDVDVAAFLETCGGDSSDESSDDSSLVDIPTTAVNAGIFNTLVAALDNADLVSAISDPNGPFTVFAPTDDAFASLPNGLVTCLLEEENKSVLSNILLYHVASGKALSTDLMNGMKIPTLLQGQDVTVDLRDGVKINDSTVTTADVLASNGVIHIINQVLVPSDVDVAAFLNTCGGSSGVESSLVDIPTTAVNAGVFNTLVAALDNADLVSAISDPNGPFTVFAPTDNAFAALPNGLVTCLLEDRNKQVLTDVLLYHVASGRVLSTDLNDEQKIPTLFAGGEVTVDLNNGGVKINDSNVISADVLASNGVIHVIDAVLVPEGRLGNLVCGSDKPDKCVYLGVSRSAGQYLTGPTHTCLCTTGGYWTQCRTNGH